MAYTYNGFNFIDLFAGAGGLSEGFVSAGFNPVAHVEMNYDACQTLKTRACYHYLINNNNRLLYNKYLRGEVNIETLQSCVPKEVLNTIINHEMSKKGMPKLFSQIDKLMIDKKIKSINLVIGGPPCQAYSLVGRAVKLNGMKDDPRNFLYQLYCRALARFKPELFVFENVPGLLTAQGGKYFSNIKKLFKRYGYELHYKILNAFDFAVLQNRKRVILIGWKKELNYSYPVFTSIQNDYTVNDILADLPILQAGETNDTYRTANYSSYLVNSGIRSEEDILTWNTARPHIERDKEIYRKVVEAWNSNGTRLKYSDLPSELKTHNNETAFLDRFKIVASDIPASQTILAHISKDGHYYIHPDITQARSLTVREAARIQSFPDNYYFEGSRTAVFTQIGNAVPPLMAKELANRIRLMMEERSE